MAYNKFNALSKRGFSSSTLIEKKTIPKPSQFQNPSDRNIKLIFSDEKIKEGIDFKVVELQIPLILNWKKTDFSIGIGAQLSTPILLSSNQEVLSFEAIDVNVYKETKKTLKNNSLSSIKRSTIDLCLNYTQWLDKLGLELGVTRKMTNFWDSNSSNGIFSFSEETTTHKVNPITLSLRMIYMLK